MNDDLHNQFVGYFDQLRQRVTTATGDWTVKGFIDVYQQIYTISLDTKVLSKILELLMFPVLAEFAAVHSYKIVLARQQNQYPISAWLRQMGPNMLLISSQPIAQV